LKNINGVKGLSGKKLLLAVILLGSAGVCLLLGLKVQQVMCDDVYILSFQQENKLFSNADISNIKNNGVDLTFVQYVFPDVSNGYCTEKATVLTTNENYAYFTGVYMEEGAFFNGMQISKKLPVAVMNETAAYQLFGNDNCTGEVIYLNQIPYKVIGIIGQQSDEEDPRIYIPYSTIELMDIPVSDTGQVWCRFDNMAEAALTVEKMGYSMDDVDVFQMDLYKCVFMQRFFFLLILIGVFVIICILQAMRYRAGELGREINRKWVLISGLQISGLLGGIFFILKMIQISWCVPPSYVLQGQGWLHATYRVLDFYTLSNVKINNMQFLNHWNLLSLLFQILFLVIYIYKPFIFENAVRTASV
jgi:hypothetical protein